MTPAKEGHVRLASYNIRKGMGTDRRRDPHRCLSVLASLRPDVVLLQEADLRLGRRPSAVPLAAVREAGLVPLDFDRSGVSMGWHGNAMLLRADWTATELAHIDLPGLEPRGAIAARIETPHGALRVVGTHLGLLRRSRLAQQRALVAWLELRAPLPTVLAGDLNEWSGHRGLELLDRWLDLHAPGRSFHARMPMAALDRIGTRDLAVRRCGVHETPLGRRASDHLPVFADLDLPGPPDRGAHPET
ncbi:metal-dependent hydrolase [Salipiger sp. IMCC34102]|uniref:endonuclease/exonuclease/phosphatase family protein n=1 Tax=Salipiger sp. IMCC34102 TaxID=2510647 RepID=UPI00101C4911|nr:endonuclease/exonuclease/phosphatase family protein [Salipiger sp. IMCC34102]RYH04145.1 metal-dependent hydrolase [Salipiger sp. IMCC34102]